MTGDAVGWPERMVVVVDTEDVKKNKINILLTRMSGGRRERTNGGDGGGGGCRRCGCKEERKKTKEKKNLQGVGGRQHERMNSCGSGHLRVRRRWMVVVLAVDPADVRKIERNV